MRFPRENLKIFLAYRKWLERIELSMIRHTLTFLRVLSSTLFPSPSFIIYFISFKSIELYSQKIFRDLGDWCLRL